MNSRIQKNIIDSSTTILEASKQMDQLKKTFTNSRRKRFLLWIS